MKKAFGILCVLFATVFGIVETVHFGNNWTPQSPEEWWCDLVSFLLVISGVFNIIDPRKKP